MLIVVRVLCVSFILTVAYVHHAFQCSYWLFIRCLLSLIVEAVTFHDFAPKYLTLPVFCRRLILTKSAICEYVKQRSKAADFGSRRKILIRFRNILCDCKNRTVYILLWPMCRLAYQSLKIATSLII